MWIYPLLVRIFVVVDTLDRVFFLQEMLLVEWMRQKMRPQACCEMPVFSHDGTKTGALTLSWVLITGMRRWDEVDRRDIWSII